jgi:hypothetical protein
MGGRNFMMGNYRYTPLCRAWDAIAIDGERSWDHEVKLSYPASARATQGKIDKLALRRGIKFVRENPWLTLKRDVIKFFNFWQLERELVAGAGQGNFGRLSAPMIVAITLIIFGSYALAMFSGIFGMVMTPPSDRWIHGLVLLVIAFICGMHTLTFGHSRYHLPLMPLILTYSASALAQAGALWKRRRTGAFWIAVGLCGVLILGWAWEIAVVDLDRYIKIIRQSI